MMRKHTYVSAEKFILSREFFGMKLGLENISEFLESIGSPQKDYKTIHVAGTNGKGSTSAMLAAMLQAQGYKTGLFTSPHLVSMRERVQVDGVLVPKRSVAAFIDRHRRELVRRKLSFFELLTAMAFDYFQKAKVDVAVIETGLGGRLDATNVLRPELTIVTDISYDHVEILGRSLAKIAGEKAGIIKESVPHLIGFLPAEAAAVMRQVCAARHAPLYRLSRREVRPCPKTMRLDFTFGDVSFRNVSPSLKGLHQLRNAALALKAAVLLQKGGLAISRKAVQRGLSHTVWPGRFQIVSHPGRPTLILDVGHNTSGVRAFVDTFRVLYPRKQAHFLVGFVKRKEHQKMFDALSEIAAEYALVPLHTNRSVDLDELIRTVRWRGRSVRKCGSVRGAYAKLLHSCSSDDIIVVIGSHYLVGEFFERIGLR